MPLPAPLLRGVTHQYQVSHLLEFVPLEATAPDERRLLGLVLPPWQRPEVWTTQQKVSFIESIFLGFGAGYYVVNGADFEKIGQPKPASGWLLDGQQRICAIRDFISGELMIFGDVLFSALDRPTALRRFLRQPFPCVELDYTADVDLLKELYNRLNFGGTPHLASQRA